jgi:hypothetical protein
MTSSFLPDREVYELSSALYEPATLESAFRSPDTCQLMHLIQHEPPRSPRAIDPVVPADRFAR